MQRSVGSGGNPRHAVRSPGVEGGEVGWWIWVVRIIWAQFEGIPKKKTMSSLQAEENKSHGEKRKSPCHWSSTELRICVGSSRRSRRGCDGQDGVENEDQSDFSHWGAFASDG